MYKYIIFTLFILLFNSCSQSNPEVSNPWESYQRESADEGLLINDKYYVFNNVTGKYTLPYSQDYKQIIYLKREASWACGWEWDLKGENTVPFYPEIIFGWNPWWKSSTTTELPILLNDLTSINVSFDIDSIAEGRYNAAFDIWICSGPVPSSDPSTGNITAEIMIWIESTEEMGFNPTATVVIENLSYDLYVRTDRPSYIAFVSQEQTWKGSISILPFLNYLLVNNYIESDHYLASIEFGNEIWSGKGRSKISNYNIRVY